MTRFAFVCDAHARTGFGHAARCRLVAEALHRRNPAIEAAFWGRFDPGAAQLIERGPPLVAVHAGAADVVGDVAFIDRMTDHDDIEAHDVALVERIAARIGHVVYMVSGQTSPRLPAQVRAIGYQPGGPPANPPTLLWSLDFAPVPASLLRHAAIERDRHRALVAFGGAPDARAPLLALAALAKVESIRAVDVLASPVAPRLPDALPLRSDQAIAMHAGVPEVGPLLARAGIVLASFGNLGYEALALGSPLCLVNTKRFQDRLAFAFETEGLAINAGMADAMDTDHLAARIRSTLVAAPRLAAVARSRIDGRGIDRIADLLLAPTQGHV